MRLAACLASLSLALPSFGQEVTTLLRYGDPVPGMGSLESVRAIDITARGKWMAWVRTDVANSERDTAILSPGGVLLRENDLVPDIPFARLDLFIEQALNEEFRLLSNVMLRGISWNKFALLLDGTVIARVGELVGATGLPAESTWVNLMRTLMAGEHVLVEAITKNNQGHLKALISMHAPGGVPVSSDTVARVGQSVPGTGETLENIGDVSTAEGGHYAYEAFLSGPPLGSKAIVVDGTVVVRSGDSSFLPGWIWLSPPSTNLAVNDQGQIAFDTYIFDGVTTTRRVMSLDGELVAMEGEVLPDVAPHALASVLASEQGLSSGGDVVWLGLLDDPNPATRVGLFLGRRLLVRTGHLIGGAPLEWIDANFSISADGRFVLFSGQLTGVGKGLFLINRELGTRYCSPAVPNSSGQPGRIEVVGSTTVAHQELRLNGVYLPPGEFGYFLASMTQDLIVAPGGSQGDLCLGGLIGRFTDQVQQAGDDGRMTALIDLENIPPGQGAVLAGDTWNFQAWYRDKNPGTTSNFTDAVAVTFE